LERIIQGVFHAWPLRELQGWTITLLRLFQSAIVTRFFRSTANQHAETRANSSIPTERAKWFPQNIWRPSAMRTLLMGALGLIGWAILGGAALAQHPAREVPMPYGYNPFKSHYGPIEAQYELDGLTHQARVKGLDYGYGVDYFFGSAPAYHYQHGPSFWRRR
jgi:hypothetical protein